uniref:CCHC-type domain-containing protein n=1 Tax=Timspurckia oligopyrenoides TaxID=708627 RepID=A0A7S0ZKF8_9RHOD|mmetsp:Transcript_8792/g.15853  ORF Transcript_8792/g.15853 Transcript_8792/m.15853 type:complete len:232 (+) Transcript_8792:51-746(+)
MEKRTSISLDELPWNLTFIPSFYVLLKEKYPDGRVVVTRRKCSSHSSYSLQKSYSCISMVKKGDSTGVSYQCKFCGEFGHNVRTCGERAKLRKTWHWQRCSKCGKAGHNARTCEKWHRDHVNSQNTQDSSLDTETEKAVVCSLCFNDRVIPCEHCNGRKASSGSDSDSTVLAYRRKARKHLLESKGLLVPETEELVSDSTNAAAFVRRREELRCMKCGGTGWLTCIACWDD